MKSRFVGSTVRDLALAIGLASGLIALLLVCASVSTPPVAAAQEDGDLWPAWTTTEPTSTLVTDKYKVWDIKEYSMTITFWTGAVKGTAVFTFAPRTDLKLPLPLLSTAYMFDIHGTYLDNGEDVSLSKAINYELLYDEARLGEATEESLSLHYIQGIRWYEWTPITVDKHANRITWKTQWLTQFGIGGMGPLNYAYLPLVVDTNSN